MRRDSSDVLTMSSSRLAALQVAEEARKATHTELFLGGWVGHLRDQRGLLRHVGPSKIAVFGERGPVRRRAKPRTSDALAGWGLEFYERGAKVLKANAPVKAGAHF